MYAFYVKIIRKPRYLRKTPSDASLLEQWPVTDIDERRQYFSVSEYTLKGF
jgi:hypothetical protein